MLRRLRIVAWNIRAGGGRRIDGIKQQLLAWRPDVIGLCEFRGTAASQWLAQQLAERGFAHQISTTAAKHPATNALLLASRWPLAPRNHSMPRSRERWLLARIDCAPAITLGLIHVPNYTAPKRKYPYLASLLKLAKGWQQGPGLVIGDSNCCKRGLDEEQPQAGRFRREHDWMLGMEDRGWVDAFRHLHGTRREFTWYSHRNNGFRLDQAFVSPELTPAIGRVRHAWGRAADAADRRDALSDHAALIVDLSFERLAAS